MIPAPLRSPLRYGHVGRDLALAVPPTLTVLAVLFLVDSVAHERLLFASLASSAFLVYRDAEHRMNDVRTMTLAQAIGLADGVLAAQAIGPGYAAGAIAMIATIVLLVVFAIVHPPAISTTLMFAFVPQRPVEIAAFVGGLVLIAILIVVQRAAFRALHRPRSVPT